MEPDSQDEDMINATAAKVAIPARSNRHSQVLNVIPSERCLGPV